MSEQSNRGWKRSLLFRRGTETYYVVTKYSPAKVCQCIHGKAHHKALSRSLSQVSGVWKFSFNWKNTWPGEQFQLFSAEQHGVSSDANKNRISSILEAFEEAGQTEHDLYDI